MGIWEDKPERVSSNDLVQPKTEGGRFELPVRQ
jgi:hypothetical protein